MSASEHSPLPWHIYLANNSGHILGADNMPVITATPLPIRRGPRTNEIVKRYSANARLIVTAVNSHDRLLAAAKYALADMSPTGHVQDKLRAAIAAAEEPAP